MVFCDFLGFLQIFSLPTWRFSANFFAERKHREQSAEKQELRGRRCRSSSCFEPNRQFNFITCKVFAEKCDTKNVSNSMPLVWKSWSCGEEVSLKTLKSKGKRCERNKTKDIPEIEQYFTCGEIAKKLSVEPKTVYEYIKRGNFPKYIVLPTKWAGARLKYRIPESSFRALLNKHEISPP